MDKKLVYPSTMSQVESLCAVVVVPTYNEIESIEKTIAVLQKVTATVTTHELKVLVIDSASFDGTPEAVANLLPTWNRLHLLTLSKRIRLGQAYSLAMRHAIDNLDADILISFDADLSHDAWRIPFMLEKIKDFDFVNGSRYLRGGKRAKWIWYRYWFSRISNSLFCWVLGYSHITDWTSGFRAIRKEVFTQLELTLQPYKAFVFQTALLHQALKVKARVTEIEFVFVDRQSGISKIRWSDTLSFLRYLFLK